MNYKTLLAAIAVAIPLLITGCSSNPRHHSGTISITTAPPASLGENQTATIAATATGGLTAAGVDWSCTPVGACGTFNPAHTASGATTVYTAPAATGPVSIIAASTETPTTTATASVTITAATGTISITTAPPASMEVNQSATIAATATGGLTAAGVDWSCTPVGTCGTFNPIHTASGGTTVYTAPRTAGPVSIIAAATAAPATTATASVTITAVVTATNLTGTYTFFANGQDASQEPTSVAGSIVINGTTGMVTGGEQDYFDDTSGNIFPSDPITTGTIVVGNDGRGTLTLTPTAAPAETFSITVVNNKHILITEFDAQVTSDGALDLQTAPTSVPTGGNAYALLDATDATSFGGVLTSNGTIATATESDDDLIGAVDFDFLTMTIAFTPPDPSGRGTVTFVDPNFNGAAPFTLAYYVVGPEAFRLIEFDGVGFATGSMYGQGTGTFSGASLGSKFVFGQAGIEAPGTGVGSYSAAGQFAGNGTTAFSSGVADVNLGDGAPVLAGSLTAGTGTSYFVNANGYSGVVLTGGTGANTDGLGNFGFYLTDPAINVADPNNTSGGGGAVMLDLDVDDIGVGVVAPQATTPTFSGNFAISLDGYFQNTTTNSYYSLLGEVTSDGTSKVAGLADYNEGEIALNPGVTLAGTYTADATNPGRSTMQLTINGAATPNNLTLYQASSSLVLQIDVDSPSDGFGNIGFGVYELQQ
jgi:hypothetical protein